MRSRYSAYALGLDDYVFRTWHPRTRPDDVRTGGVTFTGLTVTEVSRGGPTDQQGVVAFVARYHDASGPGELRERSMFSRRAGRWMYVDGEVS